MGEDDNAMQYDQDMIFRHLYVHDPVPSFPYPDIEPFHEVLLHRLTFQRSNERDAGQAKLGERRCDKRRVNISYLKGTPARFTDINKPIGLRRWRL